MSDTMQWVYALVVYKRSMVDNQLVFSLPTVNAPPNSLFEVLLSLFLTNATKDIRPLEPL